VCPIPVADPRAPPVYLPVGVGGLTRLELSPGFPNGIGTPSVSNGEVAMLCAEGIDVRALDLESFPASFSIVRRAGRVYGNLWSAGRTPEDVTTQWLTFDVDATGYFGQGEHAAIALFLDAPALAGRLPAIIGNGIVFGEVELAPSGCGGSSFPSVPIDNTEVEAFWRGGNSLWGESCGSAALANDQVYRFLVRADTAGAVRYESRTGAAQAVASAVIDTSARRPALDPANGGILIGSTNFCSTCPDFEIRFTHVAAGWSAWPIDDPRMAAPMPLSPDVTALAFAARTTGTRAPTQRVMFTNTGSSRYAKSAASAFRIGSGSVSLA